MQKAKRGEIFETVKVSTPKTNLFDLSHRKDLTCRFGELVPVCCIEAVPGDYFHVGGKALVKFAPLVFQTLGRFDITIHYFFVPWRILWPNWETFITNGGDNTTEPLPAFPAIGFINGEPYADRKLPNYLGIPPIPTDAIPGAFEDVNALPFFAYQKIYNEYYRDQNLIGPVPDEAVDGSNQSVISEITNLRYRAWSRDYFTSALPEAQRGNPVAVPIGQFEDVQVKVQKTAEGSGVTTFTATPSNLAVGRQDSTNPDILDGLYAQTSQMESGAITITELRTAEKLQEYLEKSMRAGNRYFEFNRAHFGVTSPDASLQRPQYIAGVKSPVVIGEVLSTADTGDQPVGGMAGHGLGVAAGKFGNFFCVEHGCIMGIMSIMPQPTYFQGMPKLFTKWKDPFQYYTPEFAHVGEQPIENREVYAFRDSDELGSATWGYTPRYCEYRYENNRVHTDFQTTLKDFTAARIFAGPPVLNQQFIECNPNETERIFAVTDGSDKLWCSVVNVINAARRMPVFGDPKW